MKRQGRHCGLRTHMHAQSSRLQTPGYESSSGSQIGDHSPVCFSHDVVINTGCSRDLVSALLCLKKELWTRFDSLMDEPGDSKHARQRTIHNVPQLFGALLHLVLMCTDPYFSPPPQSVSLLFLNGEMFQSCHQSHDIKSH